jgi:abequosyltransferase
VPSKEISYLLSVCIPTYNRARFIGEALESVVSQYEKSWDGKVEICVSDNASSDDTENKVLSFRSKSSLPITYSKNENNQGFDRNLLKAVSLAHGRYCWLLGDDDIIESGGISQVLGILEKEKNLSGISVKRSAYSLDLSHRILDGSMPSQSRLYQDLETAFRALAFYVCYISGQIVNKNLWDGVVAEFPIQNYLNAYVHIYIIGQMLRKNPRWMYWANPLVGWRSGNDSFLSEMGRFRRLEIDVVGYRDIALGVFGRGPMYHYVMALVGSHHVCYHLMTARSDNVSAGFFVKALGLCLKNYWRYPAFWFKTFPLFLMPSSVYKSFRWIYRRTWKKRLIKEQGLRA